jgi:hypothetical protein
MFQSVQNTVAVIVFAANVTIGEKGGVVISKGERSRVNSWVSRAVLVIYVVAVYGHGVQSRMKRHEWWCSCRKWVGKSVKV